LKQVEAAVQSLIDEGYFLVEDLPEAMDRASRKYDYFLGKNHSS